jgi:hypothetical protein
MVPIRVDDVSFADAPPEFVRGNIIDAYPRWHDCLEELFAALDEGNIPKTPTPDASILRTIIDTREEGRRFVVRSPETYLTNWFPVVTPPKRIRYYHFDGLQTQILSNRITLLVNFTAETE